MLLHIAETAVSSSLYRGTSPRSVDNRELKHVGRQDDDDGNQYNESMKRKK
jgi:hypothetical protein